MTSRRGFLASLLGGVAVAVIAPTEVLKVFSVPSSTPVSATFGQYADYCNFSELATVYYDKQAVDLLKSSFTFESLATQKEIPVNEGRLVNLFSYRMGCE